MGLISIFAAHSYQITWAAVIFCPVGAALCNGTPNDDTIWGRSDDTIIHGLGGNDHIIGAFAVNNNIFGDDGNDFLIGGRESDFLAGGRGHDKYDGLGGDDSLFEAPYEEGIFFDSDDIMSGGSGNDYLEAAGGADRIHGGPGQDTLRPNAWYRDFSRDIVDCGSDSVDYAYIYSGDHDIASINCEQIFDYDG
jgi:hypothetical protein